MDIGDLGFGISKLVFFSEDGKQFALYSEKFVADSLNSFLCF